MDKKPQVFKDGRVKVHPMIKDWMLQAGEGGWIAAPYSYDIGGQPLPVTMRTATSFMFCAANYSAAVYPGLTTGASGLIVTFADEELQQTYLSNMFAGKWQGTMALTEPQAGSSLADIRTKAIPTEAGHYLD